MCETLKLRISKTELARILKVKEMEIVLAERNSRIFRGLKLPRKNSRGYIMGDVIEFLKKMEEQQK